MAPKAKKQEQVDLGDDEAATPGTHIDPGNAVIFSKVFEPAIEHLESLPQFEDWQCPSFLKTEAKDTDTEVGGYMAPFNKKGMLGCTGKSRTVYLCYSVSTLRPQILTNTRRCP
jgi:hypothetical protein